MKTMIFYVTGLLCLFVTAATAQTFEERAGIIAKNIERITKQEKDSLKAEVESVNIQMENKAITKEEADAKKQQYAEVRAKNIETRVAVEEEKLGQLVRDKVDGKVRKEKFRIVFNESDNDTTKTKEISYKRTTSQFVFALGVNRLVTDDEIDNDNFKWRSDFYEWGVAFNTRIFKNNNLLHAKYGLSLQYNNLRPDNDMMFVTDGGKTGLVESGLNLDVARLRYVNLVIPVHLEFDFTKKNVNGDKTYFPTHKSFRLGVGGYTGFNVKEKQILKYSQDGHDVKTKQKGDFNVSDFVYGVSAYVGYREVSLYAKYDLQPVFANNDVDSNNLSLGIRFDFN
ncbi:hypothetical protein [uncultured Flavobacterium sp.]|uniref:hypothetical protein n=1 Tax=uncultured Flavobacterium sp. TaxID=165435 RepID=UPI0025FE7C66|nr:hypothetical protein [uncultured Flavobacterium sp.]